MTRVTGIVVGLAAVTALAGQPGRPAIDVSAMREAMGLTTDAEGSPYPSAASYAHFLRARLSHHEGDHRAALDELRLALASDDGNPYLMTGLAEQYARAAELDRAEAQLKRVIERHPDYAPAQLLMGRVLFEAQKATRARAHLARAIKLRPQHPDAYLVLTQLWLDQGRVDDAVRVVEELGAAVPGEPVGYHRLGLALAERGDGGKAEKLLQRAVERDPGDVEAWGTLARLYEASERVPKAMEAWEKALERDPESREVLLNAGRVALRLGRVADARAYFDQLLSQGRDPEVAVKVAFTYLASHQLALAADVLDHARASGLEPRLHFYAGLVHERVRAFGRAADAFAAVPPGLGDVSLEARLHRGICLSQLGQHKAALDALRRLAEDKPALSGLWPALARVQERAGQPKDAEATLLRAVGQAGATEDVEALAGLYSRLGRHGEAVAVLSGALARTPKEETLVFALAQAQERQGDWQKAVATVRQLLDGEPRHAAALNYVGYTLAQHGGDLDEAERLLRRALVVKPESPAYLDSLGYVLLRRGDGPQAFEVLERAVRGGPEDATLLEHLGDAALAVGQKARALEVFSRAKALLELAPDEAERPGQRADLERRLKLLSPGQKGR